MRVLLWLGWLPGGADNTGRKLSAWELQSSLQITPTLSAPVRVSKHCPRSHLDEEQRLKSPCVKQRYACKPSLHIKTYMHSACSAKSRFRLQNRSYVATVWYTMTLEGRMHAGTHIPCSPKVPMPWAGVVYECAVEYGEKDLLPRKTPMEHHPQIPRPNNLGK